MDILKHPTELIKKSKRILITTHIQPDADGLGSLFALSEGLKELKKETTLFLDEPLQEKYKFLQADAKVHTPNQLKFSKNFDLLIIVDAHSLNRVHPKIAENLHRFNEILFIDHHPAPPELKALHLIDTNVSATGELTYVLLEKLKVKISSHMAMAIYTAILIDTNSFRYPNITSKTHEVVAQLLATGIEPNSIYQKMYGLQQLSFLHLVGKVLGNAKQSKSKEVAYITLKIKELEKFNVDVEDTHGLINYLLSLSDVKVVCMFREVSKNETKVSLRSIQKIDVGTIAISLGGGGHHFSSAAIIKKPMSEAVNEVLHKIEIILERINHS